jgi:aspartate racemase
MSLDSKGMAAAAAAKHPSRNPTPMRTIGIIGGIGPQATMDFEARVHDEARRRVAPHFNSGYPPLVVYYHRRPPVIVGEDGLALLPVCIDPELRRAAARMGPMVDFFVITSNGAHHIAAEIERASGRPVLSMVDRVVEEIARRKWHRVGLMTLGKPTIYTAPLSARGIGFETLDEERQTVVDQAIFAVMEGRVDDSAKDAAREAIAILRSRGVDGVILGCTELPFLVEAGADTTLINPIQLLAESAVEHALRPASDLSTR